MMEMYAFKDVLIGFMEPFLQQNRAVAMRSFQQTMTNENSGISRYQKDIELWKIGNFNEETGEITPELEYVMAGRDVKKGGTTE